MISWNDFEKVEMRVGTVLKCEEFPEARNPSYKLTVDFGEHGIKKTSAQITELYKPEELVGRQVVGVINFPPKQIGNFMSEFLVIGSVDGKTITLLQPDRKVENGLRIA